MECSEQVQMPSPHVIYAVLCREVACLWAAGVNGQAGAISASARCMYGHSHGVGEAPAGLGALQPVRHIHELARNMQLSSARAPTQPAAVNGQAGASHSGGIIPRVCPPNAT